MTDIWSALAEVDDTTLERLAGTLESRAAEPQQRAFLQAYLADIDFPAQAEVLEVGCGTGVIAKVLAGLPGVAHVTGIDPEPRLLAQARAGAGARLSFETGDGRQLPLAEHSIDVVVLHTVLTHVEDPDQFISEAYRVLRPGGYIAIFDGDFTTATVAISAFDPLDACIKSAINTATHDPWLARRLPKQLSEAGFSLHKTRSHAYLEAGSAGYFHGVFERGVDDLHSRSVIDAGTATALKAEARRRIDNRTWFAHLAFLSVVARKPPPAR